MKRLTEGDWLDHGLRTLAVSGHGSLKAAKMAEALGVSRGSFYWHFKDIRDFRERLLMHWQTLTTDAIIREMEAKAEKAERLPDLMVRAFSAKPQLEKAIRAWADHDADAQAHLIKVDKLRIGYIHKLLTMAGVDAKIAGSRARFLYAASLGDAAIAPDAVSRHSTTDLHALAALLTR
ncbi:MAG: TetR family transcriptional regulator [Pseudomonadota bacterium]